LATNADRTVVQNPSNGVGVAALVVGVVALVLAILVVFFPLAGLLGLIALILGVVGMGRASRGVANNRGQALGGLITGLLALIIAIAVGVGIGSFFFGHVNDFRKLGSCWKKANTRIEKRACANAFSNRVTH
jgi:membrane-bound ClpP family serine protease